jgi:hypothetical protein
VLAPPGQKLPGDTPQLRALCERLVPGEAPQYVDVDDPPPPWAIVNECFPNVQRAVELHGGEMQIGWQFWEPIPGVLIEAEFHSVWRDPAGGYRDLTPKTNRAARILFLPDPVRRYDGRQVDNVRIPLVDDPLVSEFVRMCERWYEVTNEGELADYHGALKLTPEMRQIRVRREQLGMQIATKYFGLGR